MKRQIPNRRMVPVATEFDDATGFVRHQFRDSKLQLVVWSRRGVLWSYALQYEIDTEREWLVYWGNLEGTSFYRIADRSSVENTTGVTARIAIFVPMSDPPALHDLHAEFLVRSRLLDDVFRDFVLRHLASMTCVKAANRT